MKKTLSLSLCVLLLAGIFTGFAVAEETPTLKVLLNYTGYDPNEDPYAATLEAMTGYHVQYDTLPSEEPLTKLNAILAAQEDYDIIVLTFAQFESLVGLGAYTPLNDLLTAYAPQLYAGTDPSLLINTTVNGDIMGIPFRLSNENYYNGLRVRTDLLAEAGVEKMLETPDELYTALKTVRETLGIIPFSGSGAIVDEIAGAFGISNVWNVTEEGLSHRAAMDGTKEYVAYMNKLYAEGLLDSEWAQNSSNTIDEKFLSGNALIYGVSWWDEPAATTTLLTNFPDATYDYLPPLEGENGSGMPMNRGANNVAVIPRSAKNVQAALEWMNAKVETAEVFRELCIGTEGTHYEIAANGEYMPIQPAFSDDLSHANDYMTGSIASDYGVYWSQTRLRKNDTLYAEYMKMQANIAKATIYYEPISFMPADNEYNDLAGSVNTYVNDTLLQMIVGTRPLGEWDTFVQEFLDMGGSRMTEIVNEWWDANKDALAPLVTK